MFNQYNKNEMEHDGGEALSRWITIALLACGWAGSMLIQYGVFSTRLEYQATRTEALERANATHIGRPEFDQARNDLANRLERIERKIDQLR